ncbi:MAG: hypothetical protein ACYSU7_01770 [Planctomycetota bacterium]|jgi:hypothetical protein
MTDSQTPPSADRLIEMLLHQQQLVGELDRLADGQMALIDGGESDALLDLLTDRQRLVDELSAGQDRLTGLSESLRETDTVTEGVRDRVAELVDDIADQLSRIVNRDEQDRVRLRTERDRTADEISGLHTAKQAQHAYVNHKARNNRFADRRG